MLRVIAVAVGAALILAARLTIRRTKFGRSMRVTFQDPMAASLVGIRTLLVHARTFALGCAPAAAGMRPASSYSVDPSSGNLVKLKSFVVVILGGMGPCAGAIIQAPEITYAPHNEAFDESMRLPSEALSLPKPSKKDVYWRTTLIVGAYLYVRRGRTLCGRRGGAYLPLAAARAAKTKGACAWLGR